MSAVERSNSMLSTISQPAYQIASLLGVAANVYEIGRKTSDIFELVKNNCPSHVSAYGGPLLCSIVPGLYIALASGMAANATLGMGQAISPNAPLSTGRKMLLLLSAAAPVINIALIVNDYAPSAPLTNAVRIGGMLMGCYSAVSFLSNPTTPHQKMS